MTSAQRFEPAGSALTSPAGPILTPFCSAGRAFWLRTWVTGESVRRAPEADEGGASQRGRSERLNLWLGSSVHFVLQWLIAKLSVGMSRGSAFDFAPSLTRSARRYNPEVSQKNPYTGFRVVRTLPGKSER